MKETSSKARVLPIRKAASCLVPWAIILVLTLSQFPTGLAQTAHLAESSSQTFSHIILFSWDGVQYTHLMELYNSNQLANLKSLLNETRLPILRALITDHYTETNYGHPSLLSGAGQGTVPGCPDNVTVWENIENWNSSWATGSIAGKSKFSTLIFPEAQNDIDYSYAEDTNAGVVAGLAIDFVHNHSDSCFFLFVHFREPDYAGHSYGENSALYANAIVECDNQLGRILSTLESEGIRDSTAVLVTTDHGFAEGGVGHSGPAWGAPSVDPNLYTIWIACSEGAVNLNDAIMEYWDQNDVAPTIYSLMGFNDYAVRWPYIRGSALWERFFNFRDVALLDVQLSVNVTTSNLLSIEVLVANLGGYTEIPTVSVYFNSNVIGVKTSFYPNVPLFGYGRDESIRKILFVWDVADVPQGAYVISANVSTVPAVGNSQPNLAYTKNETDNSNNIFEAGKVLVKNTRVDLNADGTVNVADVGIVARAFGSSPESTRWNETADLDGNMKIDIRDLGTVAKDFGKQAQLTVEILQ